MKNKIENIVFAAIKNNTEGLEVGEINYNTQLLAEGSVIDSMALVSIIVDLESELSEIFNLEISLSDDEAMSRVESPYKNVNNLVNYITELLSRNNV